MTYIDVNQTFKANIEYLKKEKGVSFSAIARKIDIPIYTIKAIRLGRSSASKEMLENLESAFPDILKSEESDEKVSISKKDFEALNHQVSTMSQEIQSLTKSVALLLTNKVEEMDKSKDEIIADLKEELKLAKERLENVKKSQENSQDD